MLHTLHKRHMQVEQEGDTPHLQEGVLFLELHKLQLQVLHKLQFQVLQHQIQV